jgi:hypothetical protein
MPLLSTIITAIPAHTKHLLSSSLLLSEQAFEAVRVDVPKKQDCNAGDFNGAHRWPLIIKFGGWSHENMDALFAASEQCICWHWVQSKSYHCWKHMD